MTTVLLRISDPQHDSSDFDDGFFLVVVVFFRLKGREKEFSFFIFFAFGLLLPFVWSLSGFLLLWLKEDQISLHRVPYRANHHRRITFVIVVFFLAGRRECSSFFIRHGRSYEPGELKRGFAREKGGDC